MSISTLESGDSVRALDALNAWQDRVQAAERAVMDDFLSACNGCDANALVPWAGMTTDWDKVKAPVIAGQPLPMRAKLLHEVMDETLDFPEGPCKSEAMQLLLNVAKGDVDSYRLALIARDLLKRMAAAHAKHSVVIV